MGLLQTKIMFLLKAFMLAVKGLICVLLIEQRRIFSLQTRQTDKTLECDVSAALIIAPLEMGFVSAAWC